MKKDRLLRIIGEITYTNLETFSEQLRELELESTKPVIVELCSEGGDTYAGLGYYGRIIKSSCPIHVKVYGAVMSAATIILAAGKHRSMHRDAWFMVHDDSQRIKVDNAKIAVSEAQHNEALEVHWARILARHSKPASAFWRDLSNKTTYLTADGCIALGLIDEVFG